jgi:glycosyltransferase involved in cell wall biosynthesis
MGRRAAILLTPRLPWPLDDGGRIAAWQTVWAAAQAHDVTLLSFVPPGTERDPVPAGLAELGITVGCVPHLPPPPLQAAVEGLFGRWPYTLARYRSAAFSATLRERVAALTPAYVLANNLHMAPYLESLGGIPTVLREQNVEHLWMERYARERGAAPAALYARVQAARLKRAEASLCRAASLTLAIQDREAEILRSLAPSARIETLPVGIDLDRFAEPRPAEPPVLLLAGSFAWEPNAAGAIRFLEEGWPRVRAGAPNATLRLAGKGPPPSLRAAAERAGVELAADVPSMPEEFARATLLLVPLWIGAGARVKIIEALGARLPVVATSFACEGLGLAPGMHYMEGESAAELGERALELLRDRSRRDGLARAGRAVAEERWSLPAVARLQNRLVAEVAR